MKELVKKQERVFEKFSDLLKYTGFILTFVSIIAYLIIVSVIIRGFTVNLGKEALLIFLILGAVDGILIGLSLRIQGITFAEEEVESKKILNELTKLKGESKDEKLRPLWQYHLTNILKDVFIKGLSIVVSLYFAIEVAYKGLQDMKYFWLAVANIFMFLGFGMMSLANSYKYYLNEINPLNQQKINKMKGVGKIEQTTSIKRDVIEGDNECNGTGSNQDASEDRNGS